MDRARRPGGWPHQRRGPRCDHATPSRAAARDALRAARGEGRRAHQELEDARAKTLRRLALAAECRDDDTFEHTERVGSISAQIATGLRLEEDQVEILRLAAPLHDVGKIGIPDDILLKPGKLTTEEYEVMKTHTMLGARLLTGSGSPVLQTATLIAESHHEHWDGNGYPRGCAGETIPLVGRIVAVADVFDALTHDRPYKTAWPTARAIAEIERKAGSHFDPRVVAAFLATHNAESIDTEHSETHKPPRTTNPNPRRRPAYSTAAAPRLPDYERDSKSANHTLRTHTDDDLRVHRSKVATCPFAAREAEAALPCGAHLRRMADLDWRQEGQSL